MICPQDILAEEAVSFSLGDGYLEPPYSERILSATVDISLVGSYGIAGDEHPFDERVGVTL